MALSLTDIVSLAKSGYTVSDVKELISLSKEPEPEPEKQEPEKKDPEPEPEKQEPEKKEPEKQEPEKKDPEKKEPDPTAEYKKQIEELQKQIKDLQTANTKKDASGGADQKTSEQIFLDAARGLLS